ncbi:coiled-coil domain-containing protein 190 isoform X2 [Sorex araneus]|uniref:coiled-coil domain-containing protein 190 isoform X2 n=1 Tax=Sorex araneus TaxID=42254 RepID=UPI002433EA53|nr:coiled-coil domain-containing protein 190 isoform X2 [Sorex araneus]
MQQPGRAPARRPPRPQLDLERAEARRAEARLGQQLRALDTARLVHAQLRAWEQRQLRAELRRLQAITRRTGHSDPREGPERARHMDGTAQTGPPRAPAWPREAPALEPDPQEQAATPDGTAEKPPTPGTEASGTPEPRDSPDPGPGAEGDAHPAPELLARAGRAHYIRHRAPPEWERLLSVREVFGHQEGCGGEGRGPGSPQPQREGVRNKTGEK